MGQVLVCADSDALEIYRGQKMVGEAGIEPTTPGLEGRCSIRLSYSPARDIPAVLPATLL